MEIILKEDLQGLGYKNDTVTVKAGYGRNYLIPKGLALLATPTNKKIAAENARQAKHKLARLKEDAEALVQQIEALTVEIAAKAGENERIFGAITPLQISNALKEHKILVDRKHIHVDKGIKTLGVHEAVLTLHKDVSHTLRFRVIADS